MKKTFNFKLFIFAFILGLVVAGGISVLASNIFASQITYNNTTVDLALDDLYTKANSSKVATQVATLTTQGASYTMQNDGYVTGTMNSSYGVAAAAIYFNTTSHNDLDNAISYVSANHNFALSTSVFVPSGTTVYTRTGYGTYNLTVYEWK